MECVVKDKEKINKLKISDKDLELYLGKKKYEYNDNEVSAIPGIVNGLAYTEFGGVILPIEVTYYKGKNDLILTGSLGDVMKESAQIALSYIKTHYKEFNIEYKTLESSDIHIHVPEGAVQKDGPSAGITLTSSIISAFSNMPIDKNIAMTGEMTLRGNILPVGGLKEKVIGAHRSNIKTILIPKKNESDLDDIPEDIKKDITFILVEDYKDVYEAIKVK